MKKLIQCLPRCYEPMLVLLIVGVAASLIYALYRATSTSGGSGAQFSFITSFDDVTGIKERSKVLFKGMPVGTVRGLTYDTATDKILVRIDIQQAVAIPANIQPFLESSLFGEAHIALKTDPAKPTTQLLASIAGGGGRGTAPLHRFEGVRLSKAETLLPGFDAQAKQVMVDASEALTVARSAVLELHKEMGSRVVGPVQECMDEMKRIIKGPEGQADKGLAAELQKTLDDLERHSDSLDSFLNGSSDGSTKGLIAMTHDVSGDWDTIVTKILEGRNQALDELKHVSDSLEEAGKAISRSETQIQKLGSASDDFKQTSKSVREFSEILKLKPNAVVWGMSDQQRAMLNSQRPERRQPTGAGKQ